MAKGNLLRNNSPTLNFREINDIYIRKNFENLQEYFNSQNQLFGFKFFEVVFDKAETNYKLAHGLGSIPQDIIISLISGDGVATFNLGLFTTNEIDITTSGACRLRFYVGTYWDSLPKPFTSDAVMQVSADQTTTLADDPAVSSALVPTGSVLAFAGTNVPVGFLLCDGTSYPVATYPALAGVLFDESTGNYASGSGSVTEFNVPDYRGAFLRGVAHGFPRDPDAATRTADVTGANTGDNVGSFQGEACNRFRDVDGDLTDGGSTAATTVIPADGSYSAFWGMDGSALPSARSRFRNTGSETRPSNLYVNYIIKT